MSETRVIGVSVKNGKQYPIFSTNKTINAEEKESYRKELSELYKREVYLLTAPVNSDYTLPQSYKGDSEERKVVPIEFIEDYL